MSLTLILLWLAAYIFGALPVSYIIAKAARGIDLTKQGTGQAGAGNLWRLTNWKYGLPVVLFDLGKGMLVIWLAGALGLDSTGQIIAATGAIIGHNWPLFLRFNGGRGIGTTMGVILILPLLNHDIPIWGLATTAGILIFGTLLMRTSPVAALLATASAPLVLWPTGAPTGVVLTYTAILAIVIIKRLTSPVSAEGRHIGKTSLFLNRLFFDRDIGDKKKWLYRNTPAKDS